MGVEKKKKDKDAPKRAMTPFFCFQKARRESLKKEQPKLSNTDIVKVRRTYGMTAENG